MHPLYELLASFGVHDAHFAKRVRSWTYDETVRFVAEASSVFETSGPSEATQVTFLANGRLSGDASTCGRAKCRVSHADELARFALLYADQVAMQNPLPVVPSDDRPRKHLAEDLINVLPVLQHVRPAVEAGCVSLVPHCICRTQTKEVVHAANERMRAAAELLNEYYSENLRVAIQIWKGDRKSLDVSISGPDSIIEHGGIHYLVKGPSPRMKELLGDRKKRKFTPSEVQDLRLCYPLIQPVVHDIFLQDLYSRYGFRYLSNRSLDGTFIRESNLESDRVGCDALLEGLSHAVPSCSKADISVLARLRKTEGDSFKLYRDSLNNVVSSLGETGQLTPGIVRDALNDQIRPEINKIQASIKNARNAMLKEVGQDLLLGAGTVAVGVASGYLQSDVGAALSILGGFRFGRDVIDKSRKAFDVPDEARRNPYFYLWKLDRNSRRWIY